MKPFNLTPRRKEILWHIAYDYEVHVRIVRIFIPGRINERVPQFHLAETNINKIIIILKRAGLVKCTSWGTDVSITPRGMQALLDSI